MYIYMYMCIYVYIYIYIYCSQRQRAVLAGVTTTMSSCNLGPLAPVARLVYHLDLNPWSEWGMMTKIAGHLAPPSTL